MTAWRTSYCVSTKKDPSPEERELAELLTILIENYEERRFPIRQSSPRQTLQHLMESRNFTQKDMWKVFKSRGITSEVFQRQAIDQQDAGEKTGGFLQRWRGIIHLVGFVNRRMPKPRGPML